MNPLDWSLVSGWLPAVVLVACLVSLLALVAGGSGAGSRRWFLLWLPLIAAVTVGITLLLAWLINDVWRPFADLLPTSIVVWAWIGLFGVVLALASQFRVRRWYWHAGLVLAGLIVLVAAVSRVNIFYQEYPTLRSALGPWLDKKPVLPASQEHHASAVAARPGQTLASIWHPPANMPKTGTIYQADIPGTVSKFQARPGYVYLPPAYLARPRAVLPVLVLLAGQPGSPREWVDSGGIASMMDGFAAQHAGLAPVVVMPDDLGSQFANPLCLNSRLGNAQTYLTTDVPHWVSSHLQVRAPSSEQGWAIAGFSDGGTCSIQLTTQAPKLYPIFDDISGQDRPSLGPLRLTIDKAFGGDVAAWQQVNPLDVMARARFPGNTGIFVGGEADRVYTPQQRIMHEAALRAGMDVSLQVIPGGHNWQVWGPGLSKNVPWLSGRLDITGPAR